MAVVATLSKGYDLDYIWKQVDRGPVKGAASYYLQASESGGEPPGRWWGPGAKALGLEPGQVVERERYDLLFGQRKAPDGTSLGRPPGGGQKAADIYAQLLAAEPHATAERRRELRLDATRRARQGPLFFDLTISLSKSISIFHASLGENVRLAREAGDVAGEGYWSGLVGEVDGMIWQAVRAGFDYFQREAGYTRTGSHNSRAACRETGQWHEADLVVVHWLQHTSRDGDMQLHVHSQIAHIARTVTDGKWRAPDSLGYNEHIGAVAAIVSQHLEEALTARFGVVWEARDDGHGFEIKGISGQMMRLFSSRRESITADLRARAARFEQQYGRVPSQREVARLAQASNFATRAAKTGTLDVARAHAGWADTLARQLGVSLASVAPSVWHDGGGHAGVRTRGPRGQGPVPSQIEVSRAAQKAVALAQQEKSIWTRADVIKYLGRVLPRTGMDPAAAATLLEDIADPERRAYLTEIAALMDARKDRIGEHAAEHVPSWALNALGSVPTHPMDRLDWQRRASSIGGYRELSGYDHPADPIGPEPVAAAPDIRAAWHEALATFGSSDGPDVRGMSDGMLLHMRDTYPIETAWAPQYVGDELRQVRAAAWDARLAGLRASAEAHAARQHGNHAEAARKHELAGSYRALHVAYRQREDVFAAVMADRADWEKATVQQRQLAVAADAELRRRHPTQHYPPLRSAEPQPAQRAEFDEPTPTAEERYGQMAQWIKDLAAGHRAFAEQLANRLSLRIPSQDPDYGDLGPAFPPWPGPDRDAILQPPKPEIPPSPQILQRVMDRDADWEAAD